MFKKTLLSFSLLAISFIASAQETKKKDSIPDGWNNSGNFAFTFNQAAFNTEWQGGGTTNYAGNISLTYDLNYRKDKVSWNNRFLLDYGLTKKKGDKYTTKTNDRLELNSILGKEIRDTNLYYSLFLNFKTQIGKGYNFNKDLEQSDPGYRTEVSHIFSPAYLQFGPGILWKKNDNLYVNVAPLTARFTIVDKQFTRVDENDVEALRKYEEKKYYGVDANKSYKFGLGASLSGYAKFQLMTNVSAENILNLYSDYLQKPENVDIDYTLNLVMKINKVLSTNVTFQAIYDDDAVQGFQIREALGIGVNFTL